MNFRKLISCLALILWGVLFSGCCNFASLEGNGARPKSVWEAYLPPAAPQQMDQIRVEAETSDVTLCFERGAYGGYKAKLHREFVWNIPFGPYHERSFWTPDKKHTGRSLCITLDSWGTTILPFMTGIFMAGDAKVYDYPGGDCLAHERFMRAGIIPIVAYESSVMPVTDGRPVPGCPNVMHSDSLCRITTGLEGVKQDEMGDCYTWSSSFLKRPEYDRLTAYYFLCGLLAFGQKNDRAYMQIAWFPIELWSLEEEPPLNRFLSRF
jgi:hypothetical protein